MQIFILKLISWIVYWHKLYTKLYDFSEKKICGNLFSPKMECWRDVSICGDFLSGRSCADQSSSLVLAGWATDHFFRPRLLYLKFSFHLDDEYYILLIKFYFSILQFIFTICIFWFENKYIVRHNPTSFTQNHKHVRQIYNQQLKKSIEKQRQIYNGYICWGKKKKSIQILKQDQRTMLSLEQIIKFRHMLFRKNDNVWVFLYFRCLNITYSDDGYRLPDRNPTSSSNRKKGKERHKEP